MTSAQRKALYDYCRELGYTTREALQELKANGTVADDTTLEALGDYVKKKDYNTMLKFLEDNL